MMIMLMPEEELSEEEWKELKKLRRRRRADKRYPLKSSKRRRSKVNDQLPPAAFEARSRRRKTVTCSSQGLVNSLNSPYTLRKDPRASGSSAYRLIPLRLPGSKVVLLGVLRLSPRVQWKSHGERCSLTHLRLRRDGAPMCLHCHLTVSET